MSKSYEEVMEEVMAIAWENAPQAMQTIAEAAADGDTAAAYYLINRTLGRPIEASKEKKSDDYGDLLRDLRELGNRDEGSPSEVPNIAGAPAPVEAGGIPAKPGAVGRTRKPRAAKTDSGRGARREELLGSDGAGS
jgi:hypothetical protein